MRGLAQGMAVGLRELKMGRTRAIIAETAFELFTTQGFEHTTITQVAAAAEVGSRTLYRYFPTKEALVLNFVDAHLDASLDRLRAEPDDTPLDTALFVLVETVLATTTECAEHVLTVYELASRTPSVQAELGRSWSQWREACTVEVCRRSRADLGDLRARLSVCAAAMVVIDVCVQSWLDSGGRVDMESLAVEALGMLRAGEVAIATPSR
ncbi:TetR/AcrR family transcriptional regulator [Kutzneria sp. NPDC052558]|uniref:TetR/AcrR family transcriptional regulator n=1 Tax=Kutzneria sp. NPDC052558 TaxID=3364121 RepID=UPI0037C5579B